MKAKIIIFSLIYLILNCWVKGQNNKPDSFDKSVSVISEFKPELRNFNKPQFKLVISKNDSFNFLIKYQFPELAQSDFYEPFTTHPLLLSFKDNQKFNKLNFINVGYGSYRRAKIEGLLHYTINNKSWLQLSGNYESFLGDLPFQDGKSGILNLDYYKSTKLFNHTINLNHQYLNFSRYGLDSMLINNLDSIDLRNPLQIFEIQYKLSSNSNLSSKWQIQPIFNFRVINDVSVKEKKEQFIHVELPFKIAINSFNNFQIKLGSIFQNLDITRNLDFKYPNTLIVPQLYKTSNNLINLNGQYTYKISQFNLEASVNNVIYNGNYKFLPSLEVKVNLFKQNLFLLGGFKSQYIPNSLYSIYLENPYVFFDNTTQIDFTEKYEGFAKVEVQLFRNIYIQGKVSLNQYKNLPLYTNNLNGLAYLTYLQETQVKSLKYEASALVKLQDNISWLTDFRYENFRGQELYSSVYGIVPLEIKSNLKWKISKRLTAHTTLQVLDGTSYIKGVDAGGNAITDFTKLGIFLNFGGSFFMTPHWEFWTSLLNIFNSNYQRWYLYPTVGFGIQAGLKYHFKLQK